MSRPNKGFSLPLPACLPPCNGGLGVLSALCGLVLLAGCAIPADTSRRAYEAPTIAASCPQWKAAKPRQASTPHSR